VFDFDCSIAVSFVRPCFSATIPKLFFVLSLLFFAIVFKANPKAL